MYNRYACEECGKEFHSQQVLDRHLQTHEIGEDGEATPFQCNLCDYKTTAHNGVALHKRSAHKVDKNNQQLMIDDNPFHQDRDSKRFAFVCEKVLKRCFFNRYRFTFKIYLFFMLIDC